MHDEMRPRQRREDLESFVERWRAQRRGLLTQLRARLPDGRGTQRGCDLEEDIRRLRQCLMDYLCAGHFTVFARLDPDGRSRRLPLLRRLLQRIESSTDLALHFHDKYDTDPASLLSEPALPDDLAQLLRVLLIRFELEDQLLDLLLEDSRTSAL